MITTEELKIKINYAAQLNEPFLFAIDYELTEGLFVPNPLSEKEIWWRVGGISNVQPQNIREGTFFNHHKVGYDTYCRKFNSVREELMKGNSFLLNLTEKTPITTDYSLEEIFHRSNSHYALLLKDKFVCFSPETFIKIEDNTISSNPMKGTISGKVEDAESVILNDYKESAEHYTIVDFIRSDISRVATNVKVDKLRYISKLNTSHGEILQVSSRISGTLPPDYKDKLGDIIFELLPAGSISGAPKEPSINILKRVEGERRGFYTGIFGYFDGTNLDTAVMIRFIENDKGKMFFRSGGGITINSSCEDEYNEIEEKIYLPFN